MAREDGMEIEPDAYVPDPSDRFFQAALAEDVRRIDAEAVAFQQAATNYDLALQQRIALKEEAERTLRSGMDSLDTDTVVHGTRALNAEEREVERLQREKAQLEQNFGNWRQQNEVRRSLHATIASQSPKVQSWAKAHYDRICENPAGYWERFQQADRDAQAEGIKPESREWFARLANTPPAYQLGSRATGAISIFVPLLLLGS